MNQRENLNLEKEIEQLATRRSPAPAPAPKTIDDVNQASAEAVMMQYEAMARSVEEMGDATKARIAKLADLLDQQIEETAAVLHERGVAAQKIIEDIGNLSKSFRDTCAEFKRKVGA